MYRNDRHCGKYVCLVKLTLCLHLISPPLSGTSNFQGAEIEKTREGKCRRSSSKTQRIEGSRPSRLASSSGARRCVRFLLPLHTDPKASTVQRMDLPPISDFRSCELCDLSLLLLSMSLSRCKIVLISSVYPNRR